MTNFLNDIVPLLGGVYAASRAGKNQPEPVGYRGGIPEYQGIRAALPNINEPDRVPGSGGRRYFTDMQYAKPNEVTAAMGIASAQIPQLQQLNLTGTSRYAPVQSTGAPLPQINYGGIPTPTEFSREDYEALITLLMQEQGGLSGTASFAAGGHVGGIADGMADQIPANIDGTQPAALSGGEFVIAADVVSGLGNGNTESGAQVLYEMMDRVRKSRTGSKRQSKQVNPNKLLPA